MGSSTSKSALTGKVWKFGDHIDTDLIIPARFLTRSDPAFLASHCMEGVDEALPVKIRPGDIFVAGENFGCGSSREHAPLSIKAAGVRCVIAGSFARIFFRNSINIGLPVLEAPGLAKKTVEGDTLRIDPEKRVILNTANGLSFPFQPYPQFLQDIIDAGGLIASIRKKTKDSPRRH